MPYEAVSTIATPFRSLKVGERVIIKLLEPFKKGRQGDDKTKEPGFVALSAILQIGDVELEHPEEVMCGFPAIAYNTIKEYVADPKNKVSTEVGLHVELTKHNKTGGGKATPMTVRIMKPVKK